ncbi:hypothetical protein ANN_06765 [Periplaneta americana]|uniref:DDE-1 domain-containing protein n=1 Tax=Periplaneta americana TaxID=6978 RepID=A0ABQ8TFQ1_PERAM|nr:hypothetical protein ANN_06765 [Periplaneta americana]
MAGLCEDGNESPDCVKTNCKVNSVWTSCDGHLGLTVRLNRREQCADYPHLNNRFLCLQKVARVAGGHSGTLPQEIGIIILSVPSHTTHKLQPVDVAVHKPFKTNFEVAVDKFQKNYPGRHIGEYDMAGLPMKQENTQIDAFQPSKVWNIECAASPEDIAPLPKAVREKQMGNLAEKE